MFSLALLGCHGLSFSFISTPRSLQPKEVEESIEYGVVVANVEPAKDVYMEELIGVAEQDSHFLDLNLCSRMTTIVLQNLEVII